MNKKLILVFSLFIISLFSFAQTSESYYGTELRGEQASKILTGANHIWIKETNSLPAFISFYEGKEMDINIFFPLVAKVFELPKNIGYKIKSEETDELGITHHRCQLTLNGIGIQNSDFVLHTKIGKVLKYNGVVFKQPTPSNTYTLSSSTALSKAMQSIGASLYKWQLTEEEDFIKREQNDPNATFLPKGEKVIVQATKNLASNDFRYAWKYDIYAHEPMGRFEVYIDASTGEVLRKDDKICHADAPSTAVTGYRGTQSIVSDSYNGSYRLRETGRGSGIQTFNLQKGTSYGAAVDFTSASTSWNLTNTNKDQYALDAHFGVEKTYDFYKNTYNRNSLNNNGLLLKSYVHYSTNYVNAYWDGTRMTFGDGNTTYNPLTSLDITGHEVTHGLTQYTANLDYSYESGALNESFSDIFGTAIEYYATPTQSNWTIGEDIGSAFRSMSAPKTRQQPNTYTGTYWYTGTGDNGGVHTNSGVQNFWYYLLCQGGTGTNDKGNAYNVTGIGRTKANAISYRNLTYYLVSTSNYADARFYALQSATDLYGGCSQEVISTGSAWYAVGVGTPYAATVTASFTNSVATGCKAPFTVYFNNTSTNGVSYIWYFGDGTTSTQANPSHTYNALGTYTVKLVTNGGTCGKDSVTKTNLISISASNPCIVNMPTSGAGLTQTSCTGTVYDDGGQYGAYADNVNSTITISPTGASKVQLTFTRFRMEANYDYLYVYDGPNTSSPLIGTYTGNTIPASITSTAASITLKEVTDGGVIDTGFAINWSCILPNSPPVANFVSDATSSCSGTIKFTDKSTGGATSWLWEFGDGKTSTLQNPTYTYLTNGTFTVKLTATNSFGSNSKTVSNMITISKPTAPSASDQNICGTSGSFSLTANTTNSVNWYDSINGVVPISSNNPYTTPTLSATKTYYVEEMTDQPTYKVGPADGSIGSGAIFNGNSVRALRFRVLKPSTLVSVLVNAQGDGFRTIQYRDTFGVVIAQRNIFVPNGSSRLQLNIDLVASPTNIYELGVQDSMNMYRNSTGASYPYNDAQGIVSIIGNNIPPSTSGAAGYYYYFYDWEVQEPACVSLRKAVTASFSPIPTASTAVTNVNCFGQSTGSASITVSNGTPSYQYSWSNGGTSATKSSLAAGNYTVTATDSKGCSVVKSISVTQPSSALSASTTKTDVNCFGQNTGSASVSASGGTTSYQYVWTGGGTAATKTGLSAGSYTVTVTDNKGCTTTSSVTIAQPTTALSATATKTDVNCFGQNTGSASVSASGGTPAYQYVWTGGGSTASKTGLSAGSYTVTVTDNKGCTTTSSVSVTQPTVLSATTSKTDVLCNGDLSGSATVSPSGGTGPYTYTWTGGSLQSSIQNLAAGTYQVTVTDSKGCIKNTSVSISQPTAISASINTSNPTCGSNNGTASVNASGGTGVLNYTWSSGQVTSSISNLGIGLYMVTVKDANNCTLVKSTTLVGNSTLSLTKSSSDVNCNGGGNGAASIIATGGNPSYIYIWSNGANTASVQNLSSGVYYVTVKDNSLCERTDSIIIGEPLALVSLASTSSITCFGANNGSASINVNGGTPNYGYNWSNGSSSSSIANLTAGNYSVTIIDSKNCSTTSSITITEPSPIEVQSTANPVSCFGGQNGSASLTATGGTPNYNFLWSNGQSLNLASALTAGAYSFTITDANGCQKNGSVMVTEPSKLSINGSTTPSAGNNGTITTTSSGGIAPYNYLWSNGATTSNLVGLSPGNYTLTLTDANGCTSTTTFKVSQTTNLKEESISSNIKLYPNPVSEVLTISFEQNTTIEKIYLTDGLGRMISAPISTHALEYRIQVSHLADAVYFLNIKAKDEQMITKKFIVGK